MMKMLANGYLGHMPGFDYEALRPTEPSLLYLTRLTELDSVSRVCSLVLNVHMVGYYYC